MMLNGCCCKWNSWQNYIIYMIWYREQSNCQSIKLGTTGNGSLFRTWFTMKINVKIIYGFRENKYDVFAQFVKKYISYICKNIHIYDSISLLFWSLRYFGYWAQFYTLSFGLIQNMSFMTSPQHTYLSLF